MTAARMPAEKAPSPSALRTLREELRLLPPRRRMERLLACPDARAVVARWPVQDLHALVHQVGLADSLELLDACPPRTVQLFVDLGAWDHDRVDMRRLATLYSALFAANPQRASARLLRMDQSLCTLFLKRHTRITDTSLEPEPDEEGLETLRTPDQRYVIQFLDAAGPEGDAEDPLGLGERGRTLARQAAQQMVLGLFQRGPACTQRVLDAARMCLGSQLEEEALERRTTRLLDLGIPPREEANRILAYLDPDTSPRVGPHGPTASPDDGIPDAALCLFVEPGELPAEPFLTAAVRGLDGAGREQFQRELAFVCNQLAVVRGVSVGDPDALHRVVREARSLCELAVAYRCGGELSRAAEVLRAGSVEELFRVGHSIGLRLGRQARALITPQRGSASAVTAWLDAPGCHVLTALLARQPRLFLGVDNHGHLDTRPFQTLEDVAAATESLTESAFRLAVGLDVLGIRPAQLESLVLGGTNFGSAAELTVEVVLTTALTHAVVSGRLAPTPLSSEDLERARTAVTDAVRVGAAGQMLADVVARAGPLFQVPQNVDVHARAVRLSAVLLSRLAGEMDSVPVHQLLDGRFVTRVVARLR